MQVNLLFLNLSLIFIERTKDKIVQWIHQSSYQIKGKLPKKLHQCFLKQNDVFYFIKFIYYILITVLNVVLSLFIFYESFHFKNNLGTRSNTQGNTAVGAHTANSDHGGYLLCCATKRVRLFLVLECLDNISVLLHLFSCLVFFSNNLRANLLKQPKPKDLVQSESRPHRKLDKKGSS